MNGASGRQVDTIWLQYQNFSVVSLNPSLSGRVLEIERGLRRGIRAHPDLQRIDFYDIDLANGSAYIHVREEGRTVYLIAYSGNSVERERKSYFMAGLDTAQIEFVATALSHSFQNEPSFTYVLPDEHTRRMVLPWFFRGLAIWATQTFGEIYTTHTAAGAALWIGPGYDLSFGQMMRTGLKTVPFELQRSSVKRCLKLIAHVETVHDRLVRGPHWRLVALGLEPSRRAKAMYQVLIEPGLSCADSARVPCYLETFDEGNLPFYTEHGFRVQGAGQIPPDGPNFWAMVRTPQASLFNSQRHGFSSTNAASRATATSHFFRFAKESDARSMIDSRYTQKQRRII
jgi:hypothetical protein